MARRICFDCDLCGGSAAGTREVCVTVGAFTDAAGATDTDQRCFDLCGACLHSLLGEFLAQLSYQEARLLTERITKAPFRDRKE